MGVGRPMGTNVVGLLRALADALEEEPQALELGTVTVGFDTEEEERLSLDLSVVQLYGALIPMERVGTAPDIQRLLSIFKGAHKVVRRKG